MRVILQGLSEQRMDLNDAVLVDNIMTMDAISGQVVPFGNGESKWGSYRVTCAYVYTRGHGLYLVRSAIMRYQNFFLSAHATNLRCIEPCELGTSVQRCACY